MSQKDLPLRIIDELIGKANEVYDYPNRHAQAGYNVLVELRQAHDEIKTCASDEAWAALGALYNSLLTYYHDFWKSHACAIFVSYDFRPCN